MRGATVAAARQFARPRPRSGRGITACKLRAVAASSPAFANLCRARVHDFVGLGAAGDAYRLGYGIGRFFAALAIIAVLIYAAIRIRRRLGVS